MRTENGERRTENGERRTENAIKVYHIFSSFGSLFSMFPIVRHCERGCQYVQGRRTIKKITHEPKGRITEFRTQRRKGTKCCKKIIRIKP